MTVPSGPSAPQTPPQRNGLAIAGFILAIVAFPIGLILSLIALVQTSRKKQKGKVLATLGVIISLAELAVVIFVIVLAVRTVAPNAGTLLDPGCTEGKEVTQAFDAAMDTDDIEVMKTELQTAIDGLDQAAEHAKTDKVRTALQALSADYQELLDALENQTETPTDLEARESAHVDAINDLCTIGGAEE